jgi:two-component system OmpR family sensor kinase
MGADVTLAYADERASLVWRVSVRIPLARPSNAAQPRDRADN